MKKKNDIGSIKTGRNIIQYGDNCQSALFIEVKSVKCGDEKEYYLSLYDINALQIFYESSCTRQYKRNSTILKGSPHGFTHKESIPKDEKRTSCIKTFKDAETSDKCAFLTAIQEKISGKTPEEEAPCIVGPLTGRQFGRIRAPLSKVLWYSVERQHLENNAPDLIAQRKFGSESGQNFLAEVTKKSQTIQREMLAILDKALKPRAAVQKKMPSTQINMRNNLL